MASSPNCDVMSELRSKVKQEEATGADEAVQERALVLYNGPSIGSASAEEPSGPSAAAATTNMFDDEEEEDFIPSLFDTEFDDSGKENNDADDVANMTAFGTADAAKGANKTPPKPTPPKPASPPRRANGIMSLFGSFGGAPAAPHGYRSVVGSLEEFTKVEVLEGENAYGCEECTRREQLRIALQRRRNNKSVCKKSVRVDALGVKDACNAVAESATDANANGNASGAEDSVLMSSPVTSSESSSGVSSESSEEDGELIIEEELEKCEAPQERALTRAEEDKLIAELDVKVSSVRTTAEKRLAIKEAPPVLAVQLKRFTQIGLRGGLRKISGHVAFPDRLDLARFMEDGLSRGSGNGKRKRVEANDEVEYVLTGVAVHCGSLTGGHYVSYVREGVDADARGGWYNCNDSRVSRAEEKSVLGSEAYLLFYERVSA